MYVRSSEYKTRNRKDKFKKSLCDFKTSVNRNGMESIYDRFKLYLVTDQYNISPIHYD